MLQTLVAFSLLSVPKLEHARLHSHRRLQQQHDQVVQTALQGLGGDLQALHGAAQRCIPLAAGEGLLQVRCRARHRMVRQRRHAEGLPHHGQLHAHTYAQVGKPKAAPLGCKLQSWLRPYEQGSYGLAAKMAAGLPGGLFLAS